MLSAAFFSIINHTEGSNVLAEKLSGGSHAVNIFKYPTAFV